MSKKAEIPPRDAVKENYYLLKTSWILTEQAWKNQFRKNKKVSDLLLTALNALDEAAMKIEDENNYEDSVANTVLRNLGWR
jgi:hypothetical protein